MLNLFGKDLVPEDFVCTPSDSECWLKTLIPMSLEIWIAKMSELSE